MFLKTKLLLSVQFLFNMSVMAEVKQNVKLDIFPMIPFRI